MTELTLPFRARGKPGEIDIRYSVSGDPQLRGPGMPFAAWGSQPQMFDAPLDTPLGNRPLAGGQVLTQTPDGLTLEEDCPTWTFSS